MEFQDYYVQLEVMPTATEQEIKQAYRRLARLYHPDVNNGDKQSEEVFKRISEAYYVLSHTDRRRQYDMLREQYYTPANNGFNGSNSFDPNLDWFQNQTLNHFTGLNFFSSFFGFFFGAEEKKPAPPPRSRPVKDRSMEVAISLEEAFHGTTRVIDIGSRSLKVYIPRGVRTGNELVLEQQGESNWIATGNLYLVVTVSPHAQWRRDGNDLHVTVPLDIFTAATGGDVDVPGIDGTIVLTVPPNTQAGHIFCVEQHGMPLLKKPEQRGHLYVTTSLVFPDYMSDAEWKVLSKLARKRQKL